MAGQTAAATFPDPGHDHGRCVDTVLARAEKTCAERGLRLTAGRRRVLEIVARSHKAIGAYQIVEEMGREQTQPAPMTVYRALDFLLSAGLIHKIESQNAYVGCHGNHVSDMAVLFICSGCGAVGESGDEAILDAISAGADDIGFSVDTPMVEVPGECTHCRARS